MTVPDHVVTAAVEAARAQGRDVAELPLATIAAAAGMSRSTLLRRLGGTRTTLDDAVRAAGFDPGERVPVRERALEAAAALISEHGLGGVTLDEVARTAGCSLPSLHAIFGGRDGLLSALFDRYTFIVALEALAANPPAEFPETIREVYRVVVSAFTDEPRLLPAVFADLLSRPAGPGGEVFAAHLPRLLGSLGALVTAEVASGRLRPIAPPLLVHLLLGPLFVHMMTRPTIERLLDLPTVDETCETFAGAFLRAAGWRDE
ncbi:TetR/AcrR family transcriptional regulator [Longispora albida]|uniref:TetR/AcrR family transcriptional regulator n=1 Tax=Longispora albida TaxID=203523 RepID=UPI00058C4D3B|nr:TetR/AcrR family transcriptional regulator [Longispora albida]